MFKKLFLILCLLGLFATPSYGAWFFGYELPSGCSDGEIPAWNAATNKYICSVGGGTGSVATDTIWDAAGDMVQGTGANTAGRTAIGTAGQTWMVNAGATAGEWGLPIPLAAGAGTVDAITANYVPDVTLTDKRIVAIRSAGANIITQPTFAPDGLTAHTIVKHGGVALVAGDIGVAGMIALLQYDLANTRWELLNPVYPPNIVSDTAYNESTWDAVTTIPPSKNAVRDQIETMLTTINGKQASNADLTAIAALACSENEIIKRNGAGAWVCGADANSGSATALNDIGDATGDGTIAQTGYKQIFTSTLNSAGAVWTMTNTTADLTADVSFIDFILTDNGDANGYFLRGYDNVSTLKWYIGAGGEVSFGSLTGSAITDSTSTTSSTVAASATGVKAAYDLANGKQAAHANLTALAGISPSAGYLGYAAGAPTVLTVLTTISSSDEAAQFYNITAPTKKAGIDASGMTASYTGWWKPVASGDAIFTNRTVPAGIYYLVEESTSQTLTNKTLTAPSMTPQLVDGSANASPDAAHLSNAIINNYGQSPTSSGTVTVTAPALIAGMNFIMIQGTALTSSGAWRLDGGSGNVYLDGSSTAVQYVTFTAQPISSSLSCFSFKSGGASTYKLKCTTLSGVSVGS